jgi:hypothetical protein
MIAGAHAIHGPPAFLDPHEVVAKVVELLLDARLAGFTYSDNADDGSDPDRDAEDGQDAP